MSAAFTNPCRDCGGTGWLRFKCGSLWRCTCNPYTRSAALPGQAGHAATPAAPRRASVPTAHDGATDTDLAHRHGTDPAGTMREIEKAKGA